MCRGLARWSGCMMLTNPGNPNHYIKTHCLAFPVPSTRWGNLGRNTAIGPGLSKLDFSVFKNNRIFKKDNSGTVCAGAGCGTNTSVDCFQRGSMSSSAQSFSIFSIRQILPRRLTTCGFRQERSARLGRGTRHARRKPPPRRFSLR